MGLLDRFRNRKQPEVPAEPPKMHNVTINLPSYFKVGDGEYHLIIDGEEHVCKPFSKLDVSLSEGTHVFRVFSTPETLADVSEELDILSDIGISVTVNVKDRTILIRLNDKLRSKMEFEKEFKEKNHIKNQ